MQKQRVSINQDKTNFDLILNPKTLEDIIHSTDDKQLKKLIENVKNKSKDSLIDYNHLDSWNFDDEFNLSMLEQFSQTMEYQMRNQPDQAQLLNNSNDSMIEPKICEDFINHFILQKDLNVYFSDLLNHLHESGVIEKFYQKATEEILSEISRIEYNVLFKDSSLASTKRQKLKNLQNDFFRCGLLIIDDNEEEITSKISKLMIKIDTINCSNYKYQTIPLMHLCGYFRELIDHKIDLYGFESELQTQINNNKDNYTNVSHQFKLIDIESLKQSIFGGSEFLIYHQYEINQMAYSKKFNNLIKKIDISNHQSQQLEKHKELLMPCISLNEILNVFQECLDQWLDFELYFGKKSFHTKTGIELIPIQSTIEKHLVMDYVRTFKIPLKVKQDTCDRYLEKSFNHDFDTEDYIHLRYDPTLISDFEDIRPLDLNDRFKITGFNIESQIDKIKDPENIEKFRQVTQNMRQQIQNQMVSDHFNMNALKKVGLLQDWFPLHNIAEIKILLLRYSNLMSITQKNFFHNLTQNEINDINDYFGQSVAVQFGFIDVILDNQRIWASFMSIVCINEILTQILMLFRIETTYSFIANSIGQIIAIFIVINQSVSTQAKQKERQAFFNILWGRGLSTNNNVELERVNFEGDIQHNYVNGFIETIPRWNIMTETFYYLSWIILLLAVIIIAVIVYLFGLLREQLLQLFNRDEQPILQYCVAFIVGFLIGSQIKIMNFVQSKIANITTNWENLKQESGFENSLYLKIFIFRFVNAQLSLIKTTVWNEFNGLCTQFEGQLSTLGLNQSQRYQDCWQDSSVTMVTIYITLQIFNFIEFFYCHATDESIIQKDDYSTVDDQITFEKRESMGKDYVDLLIENGFVMLFGATNTLIFILMCWNIQSMLNTDLVHMCTVTKRPTPRMAMSIGIFEQAYLFLMVVSIVINSVLLSYTSKAVQIIQVVLGYEQMVSEKRLDGDGFYQELGYNQTNQLIFQGMHWVVLVQVICLSLYYLGHQEKNEIHTKRNRQIEKILYWIKRKEE